MGVFEGIRAYETADGPGIFRLTDHIDRMFQSAQILGMDIPYTVEELVAATKATVASTGLGSCYIRPIAYFGYGEMGLNTLPCSVDVSIACWPWGAYLGDDALTKGVRMKISSLDPPRPQLDAAGGQDHGQLRELVAGQGRGAQGGLRRGHHAQPAGVRVSECTGENIFVARKGRFISPPLSSGALEGITQSTVIHHRRRPRLRGRRRRAGPHRPLHRRGDVRVRHRRRGVGRQLGRRPRARLPGPDDRAPSARSTAGPCGARSTATRTGSNMPSDDGPAPPAGRRPGRGRHLRHDPARRRPVRGHLAHRRRQAARRRAARPARRRAGSRAATRGANPKDADVLRPGARRAAR